MKTEKTVVEVTAYEPPCMTVVPIRGSETLLTGSMMQSWDQDLMFRNNFQESSDYDEGFATDAFGTASGWGSNFFD